MFMFGEMIKGLIKLSLDRQTSEWIESDLRFQYVYPMAIEFKIG